MLKRRCFDAREIWFFNHRRKTERDSCGVVDSSSTLPLAAQYVTDLQLGPVKKWANQVSLILVVRFEMCPDVI